MKSINDLAIEPFGGILSWLKSHELTALWLSGDLKMHSKLGKGKAIREMHIHWSHLSPCLWPSQVSEFDGLQSFRFTRGIHAVGEQLSGILQP
jgi:hypothetical protein